MLEATDDRTYSEAELKVMIAKMRAVASDFYGKAAATQVHAFIEFCGLMSKYIDVCEGAMKQGIDFTMTNVHGGKALPAESHDVLYLAEKFGCIFSGMLRSAENQALFCRAARLTQHSEEDRRMNETTTGESFPAPLHGEAHKADLRETPDDSELPLGIKSIFQGTGEAISAVECVESRIEEGYEEYHILRYFLAHMDRLFDEFSEGSRRFLAGECQECGSTEGYERATEQCSQPLKYEV